MSDVVIAVSPTYTAVAVARTLLATSNPRSSWLIDLGDPFSLEQGAAPNNVRLYGTLNRRFERSCHRLSDAVAVTTRRTRERYVAAFPESASKVAVIGPLLSVDSNDFADIRHGDGRKMVFLGRLYGSIRRPDFLLALFQRLIARPGNSDLTLHFYGEIDECLSSFTSCEALIGKRIFLHGVVARVTAIRAVTEASVLVNIGNDTPDQLPSKLIEYTAAGKAILNIAALDDDSSTEFLQGYPRHVTLIGVRRAPNALDIDIVESLLAHVDEPVEAGVIERCIAPYRLDAISRAYLDLIESAIRNRGDER